MFTFLGSGIALLNLGGCDGTGGTGYDLKKTKQNLQTNKHV